MMYQPHYVSLPEAAPAAPSVLEDPTKTEEDASLADATKESAGQVSTANTSIAAPSAAPVSTTGVAGGPGVTISQGASVNQPQVSGAVRPPPSTAMPTQAAQQGQFTLNQGMQRPGGMSHMMMGAGRGMGRGMMGGVTAAGGGMAPMARMIAQQQPGGPGIPAMSRMRLEQIRAQNLQQQQQQIRAGGGGVQYAPGTGPMMGNPPPNYRSPMTVTMNPGGMPPGGPGGMAMATHDASHNVMQQQMILRHQQVQQRRMQVARMQQLQMQQRQRAAMQMAAGGYPAGAQGQQYAMRPAPMQANPPMPMGHVMHPPQQPQYVQQAPGAGMILHGGPRPPGQPPMGYQSGMNPNMTGQPPMYR